MKLSLISKAGRGWTEAGSGGEEGWREKVGGGRGEKTPDSKQ